VGSTELARDLPRRGGTQQDGPTVVGVGSHRGERRCGRKWDGDERRLPMELKRPARERMEWHVLLANVAVAIVVVVVVVVVGVVVLLSSSLLLLL